MRTLFLIFVLTVTTVSITIAQSEPKGQNLVFEFVKGKDTFFVPYKGNDLSLKKIIELIKENKNLLDSGKAYIGITSYATMGNNEQSASEIATIQRNRVKSELITKGGATEDMFATDKQIPEPYSGLRNVVVVTIPAPLETIERILGEEKAEVVEKYYTEAKEAKKLTCNIPKEQPKVVPTEELVLDQKAETTIEEVQAPDEDTTISKKMDETPKEFETTKTSSLSIRANLLYWVGGLFNAGIEYKVPSSQIGYLLNGGYAPFANEDWDKKIGGWFISPELRYYFCKKDNWFVGLQFITGGYNYKLSDTGYQGTMIGGGLTGGYKLTLSNTFDMDFSLGLGYGSLKYDTYIHSEMGNIVRTGSNIKKNTIMPIQAGVSLIWKL